MSVYVGIDVHRKRSQVAVVTEDGTVQLNKNTVNGTEPLLRLIGDLPSGTPVAFEAAFGWGWLVQLLEDYGFEAHLVHPLRCKAIASARLKNDPLTELGGRSFGWCVRSPVMLARFRPRDRRRGYAAGVVRAGGAASRLA
jgi:transposase